MRILENELTAEQFCIIQQSVGFGIPNLDQTKVALKNSLYSVSIEADSEIVGMGRLIGDGARIFYIQDLNIMPNYQRQGLGTLILTKLLDYVKNIKTVNSYQSIAVGLMSAKDKEEFYKKFGFRKRPNEIEGNGMMLNICD
jgi:GNAT superfamily N-acetyltransferase